MNKFSSTIFLTALLIAGSAAAQDFRISDVGPSRDEAYGAFLPKLAYNPDLDQYLVAWLGSDDADGQLADENEVFIQILDAKTRNKLLPADRRISSMGGLGDATYNARLAVSVAYNSTDRNYLLAWTADDDRDGQVDDENEVFIQLVDAETGQPLLADEQRISDMYGIGNANFDAADAAVAYNSVQNEFLVTWIGTDHPQLFNEFEIFVQRIDASTGEEIDPNDQRISAMGGVGTGSEPYFIRRPAVAHDPEHDIYLVAWEAFELSGFDDAENVIVAQRLDGATAQEIAGDDVRIGSTGPHNLSFASIDVAYNATDDQFLVVWPGKTRIPSDDGTEFRRDQEIYAQAIDAVTGAEVGIDDQPVSAMGGFENPDFQADNPSVAYSSTRGRYLVVWSGDHNQGGLVEGELEIFGRWIDARDDSAAPFRISSMGGTGNPDYLAANPYVALGDRGQALVVWWGNHISRRLATREFEVFGHLMASRSR